MAGKEKRKKAKRAERDRQEVVVDLNASRRRRDKLTARANDERARLSKLLAKGVAAGLAVGELAEQAGISRTHAHRLLGAATAPVAAEQPQS